MTRVVQCAKLTKSALINLAARERASETWATRHLPIAFCNQQCHHSSSITIYFSGLVAGSTCEGAGANADPQKRRKKKLENYRLFYKVTNVFSRWFGFLWWKQ
jgi:hypothetical protein